MSLYDNINAKRKRIAAGSGEKMNSKKNSTISPKVYAESKKGFPNSKKNKNKSKKKVTA